MLLVGIGYRAACDSGCFEPARDRPIVSPTIVITSTPRKGNQPMTTFEQSQNQTDGYRGIWFELRQISGDHGDKYSGGLGTYTSKHVPMAAYAPEVEKTFFTYGGTLRDERNLQIMASFYDHAAHEVPRPTIVDPKPESDPSYDSDTVVDPHDNATLALDGAGYIWIFVAGRSRKRPGRVYQSDNPYSVASFELLHEWELFAYPQPGWCDGVLIVCFTIYDERGNRELFWQSSPNGHDWSSPTKLVGIGGHYQVSEAVDGEFITALNWHPDGDVDRRTNLYVLRTPDGGSTWETIDGTIVDPPLVEPENEALVVDYDAQDRLVYLNDITVGADGNPVILYVTSGGHEPGPANDPRRWQITRWDGSEWQTHAITESDHNYDAGSIYATDDGWWVVGPTEAGPQPYHTGGEIAVWKSLDEGRNWERIHVFPTQDGFNATYARRPRAATPPFEVFWADGDASKPSRSRLYFGALDGEFWQLPYDMEGSSAEPVAISELDR